MAKRKRREQRLFNPQALASYASPDLLPRTTANATAWRYGVVVPREEIQPQRQLKATPDDLEEIEKALIRHFAGLSAVVGTPGYGLRDPARPDQPSEMNINVTYVVYAAPLPGSDRYFRALQEELQSALAEGVILIEKQEVLLL